MLPTNTTNLPPLPRRKWRRRWVFLLFAAGAALAMSFLDPFTKNWADLEPDARDASLRSILWPVAPEVAVEKVAALLGTRPRWAVVASDPGRKTLHATHATRFWGFLDDVRLKFEPVGGGTRISGQSRSRIGRGDLGQNKRNLRELAEALRSGTPAAGAK